MSVHGFDVPPERVVDYLRSGDPVDRLNTAIDAIESSHEVTASEESVESSSSRPRTGTGSARPPSNWSRCLGSMRTLPFSEIVFR